MEAEPRAPGSSKELQTLLTRVKFFVEIPLLAIFGKRRWDRLSSRQKQVLTLSIVHNLNDYEIAMKLGISKNTVGAAGTVAASKLDLYRKDVRKLYIDEMRKMLNELSKFG